MKLSLCQTDAYQKTLQTRVISSQCTAEGVFETRLEETIFYPTGGGQPHDTGTIGGARVVDVRRDEDGQIVHVTDTEVSGQVSLEVDWGRRFDHMQQHTAQHLITALADTRFGWKTMSFHLGDHMCSIDLDSQEISQEALGELEAQVNAEVRAGRPVSHQFALPEQLEDLGVRTRGLPEGHRGDVRLIGIKGLDLNTCGGTHVSSTAQLQTIKFMGTTRIRGGQTRLSYMAGQRLLRWVETSMDRQQAMGKLLSAGVNEHVELVAKTQKDAKRLSRQVGQLQNELSGHLGRALASQEGSVLHMHRVGVDLKFLTKVANTTAEARPDAVILLTTGQEEDTGPGLFLMIGPKDRLKEAGTPVISMMEGRGGGPPGRLQGKIGRLELLEDAVGLLKQIVR